MRIDLGLESLISHFQFPDFLLYQKVILLLNPLHHRSKNVVKYLDFIGIIRELFRKGKVVQAHLFHTYPQFVYRTVDLSGNKPDQHQHGN